jgi:hypothetical protein
MAPIMPEGTPGYLAFEMQIAGGMPLSRLKMANERPCSGCCINTLVLPAHEPPLANAALMLGTDKSRGYCLEMICADFLAEANIREGQSDIFFLSLERLCQMLPEAQRIELLGRLREES